MSSSPRPFRDSSSRLQKAAAVSPVGSDSSLLEVGLGSAVVLLGVMGLHWSRDWGQRLGSLSEELFRGDRLPLLPAIPATSVPTPETDAAPTIL